MVCYIILHYIEIDETVSCINSIINNVEGDKKIIVIDNASPNDSLEGLQKIYDKNEIVTILSSDSNLGFAKGNNMGYRYAIDNVRPDFVVVMNNDMEIKQKDFQKGIEDAYNQYHYHIMGPDIYSTKKKYHQNPQTRKISTRSSLRRIYRKLWIKEKLLFLIRLKWYLKGNQLSDSNENIEEKDNYIDKVIENPLLHGSCYIFSKLYMEKHPQQCFYDKTFMYMEAEILYYLAQKNKEKMIYYPFIRVEHHEDVSTNAEYKRQYDKSKFSIRCLRQSGKVFIELMDSFDEK